MFFGMHGGGGMGRGPGGFRVYRTHGGHPFGGGGNRYHEDPRRQRGQQHQQGQGQQQQEHPLGVLGQLLQLLPVILLLFLSLFSFPAESDRPYSLHRTERHPVPRQTTAEHIYPDIPYFVSAKFERDYARDRRRLFNVEREVQQSFLYDLHRRCELERTEKARLLQTARRTFNREERQRRTEEAEAMAMPTCERWAGMVRGPPGGQG